MNRKIILPILIFCVLISGCLSGESPGKGTLQITSSPSGAEVYLDGQFQGSTPCTIADVEPGNHTLEYRYSGYKSWKSVITVSSGTSNFFAALESQQGSVAQNVITTAPLSQVTVRASSNLMIIGEKNVFSGTCTDCSNVLLTLYGPGYYAQGISLEPQKTNSASAWSYTWNPGYSVQSGKYSLVAEDGRKTTSDRVEFSVVGGGEVSISSNSYSAVRGDTLVLSGRCTSGAQSVRLVLFGPERFSGGVELGSVSVTAEKTWSFRYTLDSAMPTGLYTAYVYDIPQTGSSTTQFTVRPI
jgi:PEGA domain